MQSDDHPARDDHDPASGAAAPNQARRTRAGIEFRPYPNAPTRTRRSPANSARRATRRGTSPTPSTIWFTPTPHHPAAGASAVTDPPRLSRPGEAPATGPAGAVWPLPVLARAVTSFTEPGAAVVLLSWPAAARDGREETVPHAAVATVAELGRRPRLDDLHADTGQHDAVAPRPDAADDPDAANDRTDLLITVMPARPDTTGHTDTVAQLAARALRLGGVLVVLTHCDHSGGILVDPTGPMVTAGQNADLLYLQHIVAVHHPPAHLRPHPVHPPVGPADPRTPAVHRHVHSDVLVFAQPHDPDARPTTPHPRQP